MLDRHAAERPERVLQADGECGEAFAAEHRLGMLPGRVGEDEVIQPMTQWLPGDADVETPSARIPPAARAEPSSSAHVGEVREPLLSRYMVLTEDHLTIGAMFGPPGANPSLQAPA